MPSKNLKPWDIKWDQFGHLPVPDGIHHWLFYDSFLEGLILSKVSRKDADGNVRVHILNGKEFSRNWAEENLYSPGLFGPIGPVIVLKAQEVTTTTIEYLAQRKEEMVSDQFVVLVYDRDSAYQRDLKKTEGNGIIFDGPAFWESEQTLGFIEQWYSIKLRTEVKNFIAKNVELSIARFFQTVGAIIVGHPDPSRASVDEITPFMSQDRFDQFHLASLYGHRRFCEFFQQLLPFVDDFERIRQFFQFMQGHLIKLSDPSSRQNKGRKTRYEKDLESSGQLWRHEDLLRSLEQFASLEIEAKKRSPFLKSKIVSYFNSATLNAGR